MRARHIGWLAALLLGPQAWAAELAVSVEIPSLDVAEYHRPYVAVWVEHEDQRVAANLALWYDGKMADKEGESWLKDLRQWWRRSGRALEFPIDGVSGPTRPVGTHALNFSAGKAPLGDLPAGNYRLVVEAAREVGGRELLRVPFTWPPAQPAHGEARGTSELGLITVDTRP
jgi:hypothetical protein